MIAIFIKEIKMAQELEELILPKEGLVFREDFGKVKFTYSEKIEEGTYHEVHEEVPSNIVKLGQEKIRSYALARIEEHKKEWRRCGTIEDNIRKNHILIKTKYKGKLLEGRIVEATPLFIRVELDKPLKGNGIMNFGFGSAMMKRYVFTENHEISSAGYDASYRALKKAYEDTLHQPVKDLVEVLNTST